MNNDEKSNHSRNALPSDIEEMFLASERDIEACKSLTIGRLLNSINAEYLGDRPATANELFRVAQVGVDLFYAAIAHRDATSEVLEEARSLWGPMVDAALQECGLDPTAF